LTIEDRAVDVVVVEIRDAFPSLARGDRFLVVSRDALAALQPALVATTMEWYLRAPDVAAADIRAAALDQVRDSRLVGRAETEAAIAGSPVVSVVTVGLAVTSLVAGIYAALAVAAALALTGAARAIEVARLRALGLSRREALMLDVLEHTPTVVVAFVVGIALGISTFLLLRPGLGMDAIVGWPSSVGLTVEPVALLAILGAVLLIVAAGILLAARITGRVTPAAALRRAAE
jgi:predicted lysophospholipase L1 biosynthesis ABC-type transport system permease subunit